MHCLGANSLKNCRGTAPHKLGCDGTRSGYDLELLRAMRSVTSLPIIASGGAAQVSHLVEAIDAGADAVLAASIFP